MQRILTVIIAVLALSAPLVIAQQEGSQKDDPVIRVYVAESQAQAFDASGGSATGGTNDQTVEIQKNLQEKKECRDLRVTNRAKRAHFVITMDRSEGGLSKRLWGAGSKDNKIAVFDGWGDLIFSHSTRSVGNAVKDACKAIAEEIAGGADLITVGEAEEPE